MATACLRKKTRLPCYNQAPLLTFSIQQKIPGWAGRVKRKFNGRRHRLARAINQLQFPHTTRRIEHLVFDIARLVMFGPAVFCPSPGARLAFQLQATAMITYDPVAIQGDIFGVGNGNIHIKIKVSGRKLAGFGDNKGKTGRGCGCWDWRWRRRQWGRG
jgi:hypothetical protein